MAKSFTVHHKGQTFEFPSLIRLPYEVFKAHSDVAELEHEIAKLMAANDVDKEVVAQKSIAYNKLNDHLFSVMNEEIEGWREFSKGMSLVDLKIVLGKAAKIAQTDSISDSKDEASFFEQ